MNFTTFLVRKCFEYLLATPGLANGDGQQESDSVPGGEFPDSSRSFFPPPWIRNIPAFRSGCDRCGECITNCENNVLVRDKDGYPQIDFSRGSCSFCGKCAEACSRDIIRYDASLRPWNLRASINDKCLALNNVLCGTCAEQCEVDAIVMQKTNGAGGAPRILEEKCRGCGACYCSCPVRAITIIEGPEREKP